MNQNLHYWVDNQKIEREIPNRYEEVIPGVEWGEPGSLFTPAYWLSQLWMCGLEHKPRSPFKSSGSLPEELVFCILGGYGITAEIATAAFNACKESKLIEQLNPSIDLWLDQLQRPLTIGDREVRYRFPNSKAKYVAGAMSYLRQNSLKYNSGKELRNNLMKIDGIGFKTAGWIARNFLDTDEVAILDIHIIRAGQLCDLFKENQRVERDYVEMEDIFIQFCNALNARPAVLDCLIWEQMRTFGITALNALKAKQSLTLGATNSL